MYLYRDMEKIRENATFVLREIAQAQPGDNILVIADSESYSNARALCDVARECGYNAVILDVDMYGGQEGYDNIPIMEPVRQAILHADITFMTTPQIKTGFSTYLGSRDEGDESLLGKSKRFTFESGGMEEWNINKEEVLANRRRALALYAWLQKAKEIHITTKRGTDLYCAIHRGLDAMYPVMGIIPFYSEVAVIPSLGTVNGTVVADGASERTRNQRGFPIRPNMPTHNELYKEPMRLVFKDSILTDFSGDAVQADRLRVLLEEVSPKADLCDEIGLVTTTSPENNMYGWKVDGSHQINCIHVAIGNNRRRGEIIHSTEHVDFDVHDPMVEVDGECILKDGKFNDDIIFRHGEE
ncbi:MAG: hypothetical protein E7408_03305 [Ruminococcaceae bacterium]|nr:hypothetical protein [Oscillospiraceae bacterium]